MLTPQGPASYRCANLPTLETILFQNGYQDISTKSPYEAARYQWQRSIVILYHNGTVLLQGADLHTPRQLFAKLITRIDAEQQSLPF